MNTFIYVLRCPIANAIRYVGKTKFPETRLSGHLNAAKNNHTKHHCARWIRKLLASGLEPMLEIIYLVPDGEGWQEAETRLIAEYRAAGHPLTNSTAGGDGFHDMRPDVLAKRAARQGASLRMAWADPIARALFMAARAGCLDSPETRARMSAGVKKAYERPEVRANNAAAQKAAWSRKDADSLDRLTKKTSASMKALWADPETKAARLATLHTPEVKARRYAARDTPEKTAARIVKLKAAWVRRKARQQQLKAA